MSSTRRPSTSSGLPTAPSSRWPSSTTTASPSPPSASPTASTPSTAARHLTGFRTALTRVLNDYARKKKILKDDDPNLTGDDVREGLTAVVSVKLPEPQFEGQTKTNLGNAEVKGQVEIGRG